MYTPLLADRPRDLNPEAMTTAGNVTSQEEIQTLYDRPLAEMTNLMQRHLNYVGFSAFVKAMGFTQAADQPTTGHYEEGWAEDTVKIGAITTASTGAGTDVVVEIDADSMYTTTVTKMGTPINASYAQQNDVLELHDRTQVFVSLKDSSVTPHRLTLTPVDNAVDLVGKISVGDEYGIHGNIHPEGSGLPKTRLPRYFKYNNTFVIAKNAFHATGSEMTNTVYHETIAGDPSSARKTIYLAIKNNDMIKHEKDRSHIMLFGQQFNNITQFVTEVGLDIPIVGTEGLIEFAETSGYTDTYVSGSYAIEDFDVIARRYQDERSVGTNDLLALIGPDLATELENLFTNVLVNSPETYLDTLIPGYSTWFDQGYHENLTRSASDKVLSFGYSAIHKNGFTFHLKRLSELNDIKRMGGTGYNYSGYMIVLPLGYTEGRGGKTAPTLGYHYKAHDGYSRDVVIGDFAGAGVGGNTRFGRAVHQFDTYSSFMISEISPHYACGNTIVMQRPA